MAARGVVINIIHVGSGMADAVSEMRYNDVRATAVLLAGVRDLCPNVFLYACGVTLVSYGPVR